jgi:2-polyprenyl-3-methyl-5-hydroxy-6-metoxy-1,4-benzoquinol methylase
MLDEMDGGYEHGYRAVKSLWGVAPGSLVSDFLAGRQADGLRVLDVGAGEGKNAAAFATAGAKVDAVECSYAAIGNGKELFSGVPINWINSNALELAYCNEVYDVVIAYGLIHCLPTERAANVLLSQLQMALKPTGTFILAAFNSGSHDLSAHPGFQPLLLDHRWFLKQFEGWCLERATDSILFETHPHNGIPHHHSLTRLMAVKP